MDYYDIFVAQSDRQDTRIHEAYTNVVFNKNNSFSSGTKIQNIMMADISTPNKWYKSKKLPAGFEGIIRLEIPADSKIKNNSGLLISFPKGDLSESTLSYAMTNNAHSMPTLLFPYSISLPVNKLEPVIDASISSKLFSFDVNSPAVIDFKQELNIDQEASYLLIQNMNSDESLSNKCSLYTNKPIYTVGESINVSFANVPGHINTNLASVEILIYTPDGIPGLTQSYDWSYVKFFEKDLGPTNTLCFPLDGERDIEEFKEGDYIIRLMCNYNDLCPPVKIKVVKENLSISASLNPPPKGNFYIHKLPPGVRSVSLIGAACSDYLALSFSSQSPFVDLICETLFSLHFDAGIINSMRLCMASPNEDKRCMNNLCLLLSYLNSLLFSALSFTSCNLINTMQKFPDKDKSTDIASEIKNYIMHRIFDPLTIETIANQFFHGKAHLSRAFKDATGTSITRYISIARMLKAKELLSDDSNKSVTEIAKLLQFSDIHSFSHSFKKETGQSPTQYRTEHSSAKKPKKKKN